MGMISFFSWVAISVLATCSPASKNSDADQASEKSPPAVIIDSVAIPDQKTATPAAADQKTAEELSPAELTPELKKTPIIVSQLLQQYHFARQPIDEMKAHEWVDAYMKALDYNHMFFYESDLAKFQNKWSSQLPGMTNHGDMTMAYAIFDVFRRRLDERVAWIEERLKKPFNFDADDYYDIDRSKTPWPKDKPEADNLWERRLKFDILQEKLATKKANKDKNEDPIKTVAKRYQRLQKTSLDYDNEDIVQTYLSALTELYDPHSQYMSPSTLDDFAIGMKLSLVGIGAVLTSEDGYCTVKEIIPGGPADMDKKLKVNDRIVAVAQGDEPYVDVVDMKLRNVVKMIRGEKNTEVKLKIIPANAPDPSQLKEIKLTRDKIELTAQQASAQVIERKEEDDKIARIGVIELPSFYGDIGSDDDTTSETSARSTTEDVTLLLEKLKHEKIDGLILDLRRNGGGLLDEAIRLTGLFIDQGPVVQVKDNNGKIRVRGISNKHSALYNGPMIVLTSRQSASASEILAGALQNYERAIIVGDKSTHGKGTVQAVVELNRFLSAPNQNSGAVKLTIQKFYLPNGHSTQNRGIVPDISLPSYNDYLKIGETDFPHALPWDEIKPAKFQKVDSSELEWVKELRKRSQKRIANNKLFQLFIEDVQRLKKRMEEGKISLNEAKRLKERNVEKARRDKIRELEKKSTQVDAKTMKYVIKESKDHKPEVVVEEPKPKTEPTTTKDNPSANPLNDDDEEATYAVDLHLKETVGIMTDLLVLEKQAPHDAIAATQPDISQSENSSITKTQ